MALDISVYQCTECGGPVVSIARVETGPVEGLAEAQQAGNIAQVGQARCFDCDHVQNEIPAGGLVFHVPWPLGQEN